MATPAPDWSLWSYNPSLPLAIVATVLYTIATIHLTYLTCFRHRLWSFVTVPIAGLCLIVGYALRCYSTQQHQNIPIFATTQSLIVVAPVILAAGNYIVLGRLMRAVLPATRRRVFGWFTPKKLTWVYICADICTLNIQSSGVSLASSVGWVGPTSETGIKILLGGLALQVFTFSTYLALLVRFHMLARSLAIETAPRGWFNVLKAVYISSVLIMLRCIYRMVEFTEGQGGYALTHEWLFWVFEGLFMIVALSIYSLWHPGKYLPAEAMQDASTSMVQTSREGDVVAEESCSEGRGPKP